MTRALLREELAEKERRVRQIEIVDALISHAGEQFTIDRLVGRFGSTAKKLAKIADRAAESALIKKGRDIAGDIVYWAPTLSEREVERHRHKGDMKGYEAYLHSHWRLAESVQWERR